MDKSDTEKAGAVQQKRARTRRGEGRGRLLEAFVRLAAREGIDNVTYRSLAKEAGVTSGLASYHFPDREVLLREAITYAVARTIQQAQLSAPYPDLEEFGQNISGFVAEEPWEAAFQYDLVARVWRDPQTRAQIRALYEEYLDATQAALTAAGIPADRALTRLVFAVLDGTVIQQVISNRPGDTDEVMGLLRRILQLLPPLGPAYGAAGERDASADCMPSGRTTG